VLRPRGLEDFQTDVFELHDPRCACGKKKPQNALKVLLRNIVVHNLGHELAVHLQRDARARANQVVLVPLLRLEGGKRRSVLNRAYNRMAFGVKDRAFARFANVSRPCSS